MTRITYTVTGGTTRPRTYSGYAETPYTVAYARYRAYQTAAQLRIAGIHPQVELTRVREDAGR